MAVSLQYEIVMEQSLLFCLTMLIETVDCWHLSSTAWTLSFISRRINNTITNMSSVHAFSFLTNFLAFSEWSLSAKYYKYNNNDSVRRCVFVLTRNDFEKLKLSRITFFFKIQPSHWIIYMSITTRLWICNELIFIVRVIPILADYRN